MLPAWTSPWNGAFPGRLEVVDGNAEEPFHADHVGAAPVPVDLGGGDPGVVAVVADAVPEPALAMGLEGEVQLVEREGVDVFDRPGHVGVAGEPRQALQEPHQAPLDAEVGGDRGPQLRPLDLDHRLPPVGEHAAVHLGHGGGRQRMVLEVGEEVVDRAAEIPFDHGPDRGHVERADLPDAAPGGVGQRRRADAGGRPHQLAQLDEHRPEPAERVDDPVGRRRLPRLPARPRHPPGHRRDETHRHRPADDRHAPELGRTEGPQRRRVHDQLPGGRAVGERPPEGAPVGAGRHQRRSSVSATQLPWNPNGTRWGSVTVATGEAAKSLASRIDRWLESVAASWT